MKPKLKILTALIIAFFATSVASNTVFIAGTPYINEPFLAELQNSPGVFLQRTTDYVASITLGRDGLTAYQQQRVGEYAASGNQNTGSSQAGLPLDMGEDSSALPPPTRPEEFVAQGYTETATDIYQKTNTTQKTMYIHVGADAQFEKRMITLDGQEVEVWVAQ